MNWVKVTRIFMFAQLVFILLYDCLARYMGGVEATISYQTVLISKTAAGGLIIPVSVGLLIGHLFAPVTQAKP